MNSFKFILLLANILVINQCLISCSTATGNEDLEDARLLITKNILNNYIVEGLNVTIKYNVYNIGNSPALSVKLEDDNFPADRFEYLSGFNTVQWTRIPPAGNVSHVAVVVPKTPGAFNLTHAAITYLPNEKATKVQIGYSSDMGEVFIQRLRDYNRKFASNAIDWVLFVIMAAPSIVIPYFLWYSSKSKYERIEKRKAAKSN